MEQCCSWFQWKYTISRECIANEITEITHLLPREKTAVAFGEEGDSKPPPVHAAELEIHESRRRAKRKAQFLETCLRPSR